MIDSHTHTSLSHDGKIPMSEMLAAARAKGIEYYAITEHLDRDYLFCEHEKTIRQLDIDNYRREFERNTKDIRDMYVAFGVESSYCGLANQTYLNELPKYPFDVIINSVHTVYFQDAYFKRIYDGRTKSEVFGEYLNCVLQSVKAPYDYDIIGHIGYISRYAPFENNSLFVPEFEDKLDEILLAIIERDKTLEVNTNVKDMPTLCLPELSYVKRYKELGGTKITFSSDAHSPDRICDKYDKIAEAVKAMGFEYWTVYKQRQPQKILI